MCTIPNCDHELLVYRCGHAFAPCEDIEEALQTLSFQFPKVLELIDNQNDTSVLRSDIIDWLTTHEGWLYMPLACGLCFTEFGKSKERRESVRVGVVVGRPAHERLAEISAADLDDASGPNPWIIEINRSLVRQVSR